MGTVCGQKHELHEKLKKIIWNYLCQFHDIFTILMPEQIYRKFGKELRLSADTSDPRVRGDKREASRDAR
jgi:hypothetical protein